MFNLKKTSNRRGMQRNTQDELSMVALNSTITTRQPGSHNKRPRLNSQTPGKSTPDRITINSVPLLINASQSRAAIHGKVLQPIKTNGAQKSKTSETEYWSSFSNSGKTSQVRGQTKSFSGSKSENKSSWTASCGFPIKRDDVSLVQNEVASLTSSLGLGRSNTIRENSGSTQGSLNSTLFGNVRSPTSHFLPSLFQTIQPPPRLETSFEPGTPTFQSVGVANDTFNESNMEHQWQGPDQGHIMQGKWASRPKTKQTSKKYSIAELTDILCGESITNDSGLANQMFDPFPNPQISEGAAMQNAFSATIPPVASNGAGATENFFNFGLDENIRPVSVVNESIYFPMNNIQGDLASKKQVSFLMDSNKNDCVDRFFFDSFSTNPTTEDITIHDINGSVNLFDYN